MALTYCSPAARHERPDTEIDIASLRSAWRSLRCAQDFEKLLAGFGVSHAQCLRLAEAEFVQPVEVACSIAALRQAEGEGMGVQACMPVSVIDSAQIASAWVVRRPTAAGLVTALEWLDGDGCVVAAFTCQRHAGRSEPCEWRALIDGLLADASLD